VLVAAVALAPALWKGGFGCRERPQRFAPKWREKLAEEFEPHARETWSAAEPRATPRSLEQPTRVTIHHSAPARKYTRTKVDDVGKTIRAIQRDHQENRGWADIGYHYVIDPEGRLWEGRSNEFIGAHAGSGRLNQKNLGIVLLGNFEIQKPTDAQFELLRDLVKFLRDELGIAADEIHTHNAIRTSAGLGGTKCPGKHLSERLDELR